MGFLSLFLLCFFEMAYAVPDEHHTSFNVVLHAHSQASGDELSLVELAGLAGNAKADAVILTDYFQQKISYGVWPNPKIFKLSYEKPSVEKFGFERYVNEIEDANRVTPQVFLIPGVEVTPFYWWSGSLWGKNLTAHDYQKNLLVFGLDPKDMKVLPTVENGSLLDAYHGRQGEKAYQELIDYVQSKNGMTVWSTPDEAFGADVQYGLVRLRTAPYSESLLATEGYTGVAVFPEGMTQTGAIGGIWDKLLMQYCRGKRRQPVWAFTEAVAHQKSIKNLNAWGNVVFADNRNELSLLGSMRKGFFYVRELKTSANIQLQDFKVAGTLDGGGAVMGETINVHGNARLLIKVLLLSGVNTQDLILDIIRDGKSVANITGKNGVLDLAWQDPEPVAPGSKTYYRLYVITRPKNIGSIVSNPIFVVGE